MNNNRRIAQCALAPIDLKQQQKHSKINVSQAYGEDEMCIRDSLRAGDCGVRSGPLYRLRSDPVTAGAVRFRITVLDR